MKKLIILFIYIISYLFNANAQEVRHDSIYYPILYSKEYFEIYVGNRAVTRLDSFNAVMHQYSKCDGCSNNNSELLIHNFDYFYPYWNHAVFTFLEQCEYRNVNTLFNISAHIEDERIYETMRQLFYHMDLNDEKELRLARRILNRMHVYYPDVAQACLERLKTFDEHTERKTWVSFMLYVLFRKKIDYKDQKSLIELKKILERKKYFHTIPGFKKRIIEKTSKRNKIKSISI